MQKKNMNKDGSAPEGIVTLARKHNHTDGYARNVTKTFAQNADFGQEMNQTKYGAWSQIQNTMDASSVVVKQSDQYGQA